MNNDSMIQRITIRLDIELYNILQELKQKQFNLSGLIREALRNELTQIKNTNNSVQVGRLAKDED